MLRFSRLSKAVMLAIIGLILAFMYVPLFILILNSLNEAQVSSWPIESYSLKWWETAAELEAIRNALLNSVLVAFGAMVVASILGTLAAFALSRFSFFGKSTVNLLIVLPIALPGVVTGVAFSNTYSNFLTPAGFQIGYFGMIVAHATFCIVMVFNNVIARLRRMNPNLQEASMDLGQGVWGTFRLVTFPQFRAAFGAGAQGRQAHELRVILRPLLELGAEFGVGEVFLSEHVVGDGC